MTNHVRLSSMDQDGPVVLEGIPNDFRPGGGGGTVGSGRGKRGNRSIKSVAFSTKSNVTDASGGFSEVETGGSIEGGADSSGDELKTDRWIPRADRGGDAADRPAPGSAPHSDAVAAAAVDKRDPPSRSKSQSDWGDSSSNGSTIKNLIAVTQAESLRSVASGLKSIGSASTVPTSNLAAADTGSAASTVPTSNLAADTGNNGRGGGDPNKTGAATTAFRRPPPPPSPDAASGAVALSARMNLLPRPPSRSESEVGSEDQSGGEATSSLELGRTTEDVLWAASVSLGGSRGRSPAAGGSDDCSSSQSTGEAVGGSSARGGQRRRGTTAATLDPATPFARADTDGASMGSPLTPDLLFRTPRRSSCLRDLTAKLDAAAHPIVLGLLHDVSSADRPSSERAVEGMRLSARCAGWRLNLDMEGGGGNHETPIDETHGTLVLEGPAPLNPHGKGCGKGGLVSDDEEEVADQHRHDNREGEALWWVARVPLIQSDEDGQTKAERAAFSVESLDDVRAAHEVVLRLLSNGKFTDAVKVLSGSLLPSLVAHRAVSSAWLPEQANEGDNDALVDMTLRNIGTIQLWMGRHTDTVTTLADVVDGWHRTGVDVRSLTGWKAYDAASSLLLLGSSLYSMERHNEAKEVFLEALEIMQKPTNRDGNEAQGGNSHHKFTAGKVLNNIACTFFELGYYKSACRALHRALLVFMSDDLNCGYPGLMFDPKRDLPESFPSLTNIMNGLKTREMEIINLPPGFELDVAITFNNLAFLLVKRNKFSAAAVCLAESASLQKVVFGNDHSIRLSTMESLAFVNIKMHRYDRALRVYEDMLNLEENKFATSNLYRLTIAKLLGNMSYVYLKMHKLRAALACLKGVLANQEASLPSDDKSIEQTRNFMADIEIQLWQERDQNHND